MKKKIFEIFLYGSSLENLEKIGSGYREISYYNKLSSIFNLMVIDYEKYSFHNGISKIVQFCSEDLSAFYLDIRKDCLYISDKNSDERKSAQFTL